MASGVMTDPSPEQPMRDEMTSKMIALKVLDVVFIVATMLILLGIAGFPMGWLLAFADMSLREFQWFGLFIVFASHWLIHAIATSDSAP
jgi:hypothetical protein